MKYFVLTQEIFLIGGSSRIPRVRNVLENFFGVGPAGETVKISQNLQAQEAVELFCLGCNFFCFSRIFFRGFFFVLFFCLGNLFREFIFTIFSIFVEGSEKNQKKKSFGQAGRENFFAGNGLFEMTVCLGQVAMGTAALSGMLMGDVSQALRDLLIFVGGRGCGRERGFGG